MKVTICRVKNSQKQHPYSQLSTADLHRLVCSKRTVNEARTEAKVYTLSEVLRA